MNAILTFLLVLVIATSSASSQEVVVKFDGVRHLHNIDEPDQIIYDAARLVRASTTIFELKEAGMLLHPYIQFSPDGRHLAIYSEGRLAIFENSKDLVENIKLKSVVAWFELKDQDQNNYWKEKGCTPVYRWISARELVITTPESGDKSNFQNRIVVGIGAAHALVCHQGFLKAQLWGKDRHISLVEVSNEFQSRVLLSRCKPLDFKLWRSFFWDKGAEEYVQWMHSEETQALQNQSLDELAKHERKNS